MGTLDIVNLNRPGLDNISAHIDAGDCLVVTGASGSGKTLFLRAVADLDPNNGAVSLDTQNRANLSAPQWRRRVV